MGSICSREEDTKTIEKKKTITEFSKFSDFRMKYEFVCILGNGSFGQVRLYCDRAFKKKKYAIKTLMKECISDSTFQSMIEEVKILSALDHPNIVKYYETFEDDCYLHIVMEYLQGDDLYKILSQEREKPLEEKDICNILYQLIKALVFIHNRNIIHRDIKPENILFEEKNDFSSLKLIDFGLASTTKRKKKEIVGSPNYMSPEIIQGTYSCETDMWSVGVIMHLMLTGKFPFKGDHKGGETDLFYQIINTPFNAQSLERSEYSNEAKDLVKKLLVKNPKKRLSSSAALKHSWFSKYMRCRTSVLLCPNTIESLREFSNKTALQKELLFFIAKIKRQDELKRLKDLFNQMDTTGNGCLSLTEMRQAFEKLGYNIKEDELEKIWNGLDFHKGKGQVNYTEFLAATISSINFSKEEDMWTAYKYCEDLDQKTSGYITKESILTAAKMFGFNINEAEIDKAFEDLQENGKVLDFDEFKNLVFPSAGDSGSDKS